MPLNVCLIRPPRMMRAFSRSMKAAQAMGLAFVASPLQEKGHKVSIIDALGEAPDQQNVFLQDIVTVGLSSEEILARIPADTDVIGFSCMFTQDWLSTKQLIEFIGSHFPNATLLAGGEHITALPEYCLQKTKPLSICVLGEGEETFVATVDAIENHIPLNTIDGIAYKDETGIHKNKRRTRMRELDSLPYPAWNLLPMQKYFDNGISFGVDRGRSLALMATRGCPYECTFCSSPNMWGKRYYMRDVKKVVDEIVYFKNIYDLNNIDFYDLTAIINKEWMISFCKELLARNVNITWQLPSGTRIEALDAEVASYLAKAGCKNISYAPESGSKQTLHTIKKKLSIDLLLKSMKASLDNGLNIKMNIIIGLPEDRHKNIWETLWFIVKASWYGAHDVAPSVFMAYPGSAIFDDLMKQGKIDLDKDEYFLSILDSDNFFKIHFYNDHISKRWLQFYWLFALLLFYSTTFLFRPVRLYTFIKNVVTKKYESRGEMALGELIKRLRVKPRQSAGMQPGI